MKIKLKQIMEQNFLDFKRKYLINMSQMRNGLSNSNNSDNSNSNTVNNREQLNKSMQTITGNSKGVFAGTKESIGMLKNQEKNTALTSLNKNNNTKNITESNENIRNNNLLNDGIKKITVDNMVHPYTKEKSKILVDNKNTTNNNTNNSNQNTDNFYSIKAKESPAKLTRGVVPYGKWRKPTRENPQGRPTPILHNNFKRYLNG